ncbi:MAG: hypothetical protein ABFS18_12865 [Thermodesulfobacteriota bacterium]
MKKNVIFISTLISTSIIATNLHADGRGFIEELISDTKQFLRISQPTPSKKKGNMYKTWTVVEVTPDTIILQRKKRDDQKDDVSIDRSRRPYLKVGDRVRYDKVRNRLRRTLDR